MKNGVLVVDLETGEVLYSCHNWKEGNTMRDVYIYQGRKCEVRPNC